MKKLIIIALALILLPAMASIAHDRALRCDVNNSGSVTATDALLVLQAAVGIRTPECRRQCEDSE